MKGLAFGEIGMVCRNGYTGVTPVGIGYVSFVGPSSKALPNTVSISGTAQGYILCAVSIDGTAEITGVSHSVHGALTRIGSTMHKTTGEPGSVSCWYGSGTPTGTLTISGSGTWIVYTALLTSSSAGIAVAAYDCTTMKSDSMSNPSVTLNPGGKNALGIVCGITGRDSVLGFDALSGWNARSRYSVNSGTECVGFFTKNATSSAAFTAGWTQATADDVVAFAFALYDAAEV